MAHAFAAGPSHRDPIDVAGRERMRTGGKRKLGSNSSSPSTAHAASPSKKKKKADPDSEAGEKRLRRFRPAPPRAWHDVYQRALTQRFYVLQRERCGTQECPEEHVEMTGSTGNIYNVHIGKLSTCDCPYANKGNECKHVLYVLSQVLRAPYNLVYQRALLSSELRAIFDAAPPIPGTGFSTSGGDSQKRKTIEGDCPICFSQLKSDSPDSITWCQATCGQNMHTKCFDVWACSKRPNVTCPMCRSAWKEDTETVLKKINRDKGLRREGYVNIGKQLGLSPTRDESTYLAWFHGRSRWH